LKPAKSPAQRPARKAPAWQTVCVCVFLVLAVLAVFGQTAGFEFVNYDDNQNVSENPVVERGLSVAAVGWAFTHTQVFNWIPLTTLSHMLDCQVFGLHAGGHHRVNVLWHAANAILLFLVLRRMTGRQWRSAFVAAVFAIHPLRAESVAWVSERKDVLSAFFFMLTIGAYVSYAKEFKVQSSKFKVLYSLCLVFFVLGLMSKPMVATLPFVLLLLDYWPLGRFQHAPQFLRLVKEKIPLFVLAAGSCVVTALVPGLVVTDADQLSLLQRLDDALVSYVVYLRQMIFPAGLANLYPYPPKGYALWQAGLAFVLLAVISAGVILGRKHRPALLVGWLWYLGMLFPVIGLIQISPQAAYADRYTYLPEIGLGLAGTWAMADWSAGWKHRRLVLGGLMIVVAGVLIVCGHRQTLYWKNSESLWTRALACTSGNYLARNNLGNSLYRHGGLDAAIEQYRQALEIKPDYTDARNNLGAVLFAKGDLEAAIVQYRKALETKPDYAEAIHNLGSALARKGDYDAAIVQYRKALVLKPDYVEAQNNLGNALLLKGDLAEAIDAWQKSLEIEPGQVTVQQNLAWSLATTSDSSLRNGTKAVALAEQANQLSGGGNPAILRTLAAAYAEAGSYGKAGDTARRALALAVEEKNDALAVVLQKEIQLYQANRPVRQGPH
jgi:protein O-mannosyl-transferase